MWYNSVRSMEEVLQEEGLLLHRGAFALPHALPAPQQNGRWAGRHEVLQSASKIRHGAPTSECTLSKAGEIVVGKFVDRDRPDYCELLRAQMTETLGERYAEPEVACSR